MKKDLIGKKDKKAGDAKTKNNVAWVTES